jgi:hypothetical protein
MSILIRIVLFEGFVGGCGCVSEWLGGAERRVLANELQKRTLSEFGSIAGTDQIWGLDLESPRKSMVESAE